MLKLDLAVREVLDVFVVIEPNLEAFCELCRRLVVLAKLSSVGEESHFLGESGTLVAGYFCRR